MSKREIRPIRVEGQVAYVPLTKGYTAIIDTADVAIVEGFNWCALECKAADGTMRAVYATRTVRGPGFKRHCMMHRVIADTPEGMDTDHRDGDGLNNRRGNLRQATRSQNARNMRMKAVNTSGIKGVSWHKASNRWRATINTGTGLKHLGSFKCTTAAAIVYAKASRDLHGEFGRVA